jgi:hypothetical protein
MRRPAVRLLLTLAISACVVGSIPATTEAGIIPWAYDTVFGPLGSIQGRQAGYYGGAYGSNYGGVYGANYGGCSTGGCGTGCSTGYCGPAPRLFGGLRSLRMGFAGYGGYGMGGYGMGGYGCSTGCGYSNFGGCGSSCGGCNSCGMGGCSTGDCGTGGCGAGGCGSNGGYGAIGMQGYGGNFGGGNFGGGGCANGQCGVNYPPPLTQNNPSVNAASPVTPAAPPPVTTEATKSATPPVEPQVDPMSGRSGGNDGYPSPMAPGAGEGFRPRGAGLPSPTGGDPTAEQFVPPKKVNAPGADASPNDTNVPMPPPVEPQTGAATDPATPPVAPKPRPKRNLNDDDDDKKGTSVGPRFELNEKVTWRREVIHSRQAPTAVRVSATVNRSALFPKMAWRTTADAELAKK